MPITREEFDDTEEPTSEHSTAEAIIRYLSEHPELAFTRREIADAIDRDPNTVSTNLSRLKDRGFVEHRGKHWALTDDDGRLDELVEAVDSIPSSESEISHEPSFINDEEDAEAWADAAAEYPRGRDAQTSSGAHQQELLLESQIGNAPWIYDQGQGSQTYPFVIPEEGSSLTEELEPDHIE